MALPGPRKPSVLFFNRVYPPGRGATGRVLRDLAHAFAGDGWSVTVITTGPEALWQRDGRVRVIRIKSVMKNKTPLAYFLVWLKLLWQGFRIPRHDLIVTMTDPPLLLLMGRILRFFQKNCHIHWCQDMYPDILPALGLKPPLLLMKFLKRLTRRSLKSCDKIIVIGRCMARRLAHSGIDPRRITVIPNWPDKELALPPDAKVAFNGRKYKAVNGARPWPDLFKDTEPKFRVLYAGNIGRAHPVQGILDAAEILNTQHPEIEFVFVGDGPGQDRIAQERAKRGLDNIRLLPYQPANRLRELMESGDLHLISLRHNAAGLMVPSKLYAALAVGRPSILIGPVHSETAKVITDFHAGAVIPQGSPDMLVQAIRRYRMNGNDWFAASEGAAQAGKIFVPEESMRAWIQRARDVVYVPPIGGGRGR